MTDLVLATDDALIVSPRKDVVDFFENLGRYVLFLEPYANKSVKEVDAAFKKLAMPGIFGEEVFLDTDLPLWRVLSLDRLKFWYTPYAMEYISFIEQLEWDLAYVSLDIGSVFPVSIACLAAEYDIPCIGVKTEPIRTQEMQDIARLLPLSAYIVDSKRDVMFLRRNGVIEEISIIEEDEPEYFQLGDKKTLRETMKLPLNGYFEGILIDKRDEYLARKYVKERPGQHFFVYPVEPRSAELAKSSFYPVLPQITIITKIKVLGACDKIVAFRHDEQYPKIKDLKIVDYST
jgi:hypothetical protein